jgi:hypothetical protein
VNRDGAINPVIIPVIGIWFHYLDQRGQRTSPGKATELNIFTLQVSPITRQVLLSHLSP